MFNRQAYDKAHLKRMLKTKARCNTAVCSLELQPNDSSQCYQTVVTQKVM